LQHQQWAEWSNAEIARRSGLSDPTIAKVRSEIDANACKVKTRRCRGRNGTIRTMNTAHLGRKRGNAAKRASGKSNGADAPIRELVAELDGQLLAFLAYAPQLIRLFVEEHESEAERLVDHLERAVQLLNLSRRQLGTYVRSFRNISQASTRRT
jgi:hypothetical protein